MAELLTIKENYVFRRLYKSKQRYVFPQMVVYVSKNRLHKFRYGITASKKIGNAVKRNRCRRVIRAALNELSDVLSDGYDVVIVARTRAAYAKSTELVAPIKKGLENAGVIK